MQSPDLIGTSSYGTSKDLVSEKEEINMLTAKRFSETGSSMHLINHVFRNNNFRNT